MGSEKPNKYKGAVATILDENGRVLILLRGEGAHWRPLHWGGPGGMIEPGEDPLAAVTREVKEETGLDVRNLVQTHVSDTNIVHFATQDYDGDVQLDYEHDDFAWVYPDELTNYNIVPGLPESIRRAKKALGGMTTTKKLFESWRRFNNYDQYTVGSDPFYGPPPLINDVVDCWANEGVRFFNEVHHANGMAYHVMLPTEELEFHVEGDMGYNGVGYMSQELIQHGQPPRAVRVMVTKDGRAIVDRDSDIVMAAKHVGLAELPVLFNFVDTI
jgi:8-oxo-dGTP diphosphatase